MNSKIEAKEKTVFLFPILFKSSLQEEILIEKDLRLRRITEEEIEHFFKIKIRKRNNNGLITECDEQLFHSPLQPYIFHEMLIKSSQFFLETTDRKKADYFHQSLKLYKNGKTGLTIAFISKTPNIIYKGLNPFYGDEIYSLEEKDIDEIKKIYSKINRKKDKKFDLMMEKFLFALSGETIKDELRFLELVTILEMLYLGGAQGELKYRFSLRSAKVLSKYSSVKVGNVHTDMKNIYNIRSKISHFGSSSKTIDYLNKLIDYCRKSLNLYLQDNSIFSGENLDKVCIQG